MTDKTQLCLQLITIAIIAIACAVAASWGVIL